MATEKATAFGADFFYCLVKEKLFTSSVPLCVKMWVGCICSADSITTAQSTNWSEEEHFTLVKVCPYHFYVSITKREVKGLLQC